MASSRSLGTLTLDLITKLAGFEQGMDQAARKTDATARQIERRSKQMQKSLQDSFKKAAVGALAIGAALGTFTKSVVDATVELQKIQFTMQQAFGSRAAQEIDFVRKTSDKLGLSFKDSAVSFAQLAASAQGTGTSAKQLETFFTGISQAASVLHSSTEDVNGVLVQLSQGLSLGKLQMQDFRAIAQHLPGTMVLVNKALKNMGTNLNDALKGGGVTNVSEFIEQLGKVMQQTFGQQAVAASHSLNSELQRLKSTLFDLETSSGGFEEAFAKAIAGINNLLQSSDIKKGISQLITAIGEAAQVAVKALALMSSHLSEIAVFFATRFVAAKAIAVFTAITTGAEAAAGAVAGLRVALSLLGGPVGIAATAIALLATAVYKQQHQMSEAEKSAKDLRKAIDELKGADGAAVGPAIQHAEAVKKIAVANLAAAQAALTRLIAEKQAADESAKRLQNSSQVFGGRADSRMGASYAQTWSSVTQGNIDKKKKEIEDLQKAIQDAQKAIDKIELGVPDPKGATGGKPSIKLFDPAAARKAKQQADALAKAVAALYAEVQNVNSADDPSAKIEQDYANRIRHVAELGAAVIKAGGNVQQVQEQVAKAAQKLNQQMDFALDAPKRAMQEYQAGLDAQLKARQNEIDLQVQSIGLGDKEAAQLQELTKIRQDAAAAISKFTLQHQLHPDAMKDEQFQSQLKALKEYWEDHYNITAEGQKRVDKAQASWQNGVQKSIDNFMDGMRNGAQQGQQFMDNFISGIGDAFVQFATGAESAKKAFGSFIDQLFSDALRFVANKAIQALFDTIGAGSKQDAGTSPGWGNFFRNLVSVFGGGKAGGGLVAAGTMYRVNEGFGPEMLSVGGRDYLMMGAQAGYVTPAAQTARTTRGNTNINVMVQPTSTRRTAQQIAQEIDRKQRTATARNS